MTTRRYSPDVCSLCCFPCFCVTHHLAHIREQRFGVVDDSVMNCPPHTANTLNLAGCIVQTLRAGAVQHFEVNQEIFAHNHEVRVLAGFSRTDLVSHAEGLRARQGGGADDLERMKARLLEQLELAHPGKSKQLVDEAGIVPNRNTATRILVVVDE